jgi:hypothetical protein
VVELRAGDVVPEHFVVEHAGARCMDQRGNGACVALDPVSRFVSAPEVVVNPAYNKRRFVIKLTEMGFADAFTATVLDPLGESFTRSELKKSVAALRASSVGASASSHKRSPEGYSATAAGAAVLPLILLMFLLMGK